MLETFRKNCVNSFERNSEILSKSIIPDEYLPRVNNAFFRFSAHGELINLNHLVNLVNIVKKNPQTNFALWTKRKNLVKKYLDEHKKPKNLILVFSNMLIGSIAKLPKYFDKTFNNVYGDDKKINCFQNCLDCLLCYTKNDTETIIEKTK